MISIWHNTGLEGYTQILKNHNAMGMGFQEDFHNPIYTVPQLQLLIITYMLF